MIVLFLVLIAVIGAVFYLWATGHNSYQTVDVECIKMEDLVSYFKNTSRMSELQKNSSVVAVAIKEKKDDNSFKVLCTLFNKDTNRIVNIKNCTIAYKSSKLDESLSEAFGDKKMIVLS